MSWESPSTLDTVNLDSFVFVCPRPPRLDHQRHISSSSCRPNCNYTDERLLETTAVQLRGEPTTSANFRTGERAGGWGGVFCGASSVSNPL